MIFVIAAVLLIALVGCLGEIFYEADHVPRKTGPYFLLAVILLLCGADAFGQRNTRFDYAATTTSGSGTLLPLQAIPNAPISFYSCSAGVCTTKALTYTSVSSVTPCPSTAQVVVQLSTTCGSIADGQGNFGAWFSPGQYAYTITAFGQVFGPYIFTITGPNNGTVVIAPTATQQVFQPTGTTLAVNSLNTVIYNSDTFTGADVGARITAADAALTTAGISSGVITTTGGNCTANYSLAYNHSLHITGSMNITTCLATIASNTKVWCDRGVVITVPDNAGSFFEVTGSNDEFQGCTLTAATGNSATTFVHLDHTATRFSMHGFTSNHVGLLGSDGSLATGGASYISFYDNSVTNAGQTTALQNPSYVAIYDNDLSNNVQTIQIENGDAADKVTYGTRAAIQAMGGFYTIFGNKLNNNFGGIFIAVGHDIVVSHNVCTNPGDQCVDGEGVIDMEVSGLDCTADLTTGGGLKTCVSKFFFSNNMRVIGGLLKSDVGNNLISIKNDSGAGDPNESQDLTVENVDMRCYTVLPCNVMADDAQSGNVFKNNIIQDGVYNNGSQSDTYSILNNEFRFTVNPASPLCAITAPNLQFGTAEISYNRIIAYAPQGDPPAESNPPNIPNVTGICATSNSINAFISTWHIHDNLFDGQGMNSITAVTAGINAGIVVDWVLSENKYGAGVSFPTHTHPGTNTELWREFTAYSKSIAGGNPGIPWVLSYPFLATGSNLTACIAATTGQLYTVASGTSC